jgi:uncharacterized protein
MLLAASLAHRYLTPMPLDERAAFDQLRQVYADLEARALPRNCELLTGCCHFRLTGRQPSVTRVEAMYAAKGVRASGKKTLPTHADGACPLMAPTGKCTIYEHRPFGCRSHFCEAAGGMYPRKHVADLIRTMESIDEQMGHREGARPFEGAVADALTPAPKPRR